MLHQLVYFSASLPLFLNPPALLSGLPGPLVPREVEGVRLDLGRPLLGVLQLVGPAVLVGEEDGVLLGGEVEQHVGEGVPGGGPAHQVVLPPRLVV